MTSFANITLSELKTDCRFYTGYKPCGKFDGCPDCPHYEPRGEQVLVIKLGAMGDVLRSKALLGPLKREHPRSWIVWLTMPGSETLVRDPLVDEIRTLSPAGLLALEGRHFARLICLDKDAEAVALAGRLSADRKQGFAPTPYNTITVWNEAAMYALRLGLSDPLKFYENEKTVPELVCEIAELPYDGEKYGLVVPEPARAAAGERWEGLGLPAAAPVVGLNTGCGPVFATKAWTEEGFAGLIRGLAERGIASVLLGGPRERALHEALRTQLGDLTGRWLFDSGNDNPLEVFYGLVQRCDAVVSSDSLAMHVAIALKRPTVALFGPTCAQEVDLFGRGEKIITDFPCAPCYLKQCPLERSCMESLGPEPVLEAVLRVLPAPAEA